MSSCVWFGAGAEAEAGEKKGKVGEKKKRIRRSN
jgi:hypothetical protein